VVADPLLTDALVVADPLLTDALVVAKSAINLI
jgi:hypothetical protein